MSLWCSLHEILPDHHSSYYRPPPNSTKGEQHLKMSINSPPSMTSSRSTLPDSPGPRTPSPYDSLPLRLPLDPPPSYTEAYVDNLPNYSVTDVDLGVLQAVPTASERDDNPGQHDAGDDPPPERLGQPDWSSDRAQQQYSVSEDDALSSTFDHASAALNGSDDQPAQAASRPRSNALSLPPCFSSIPIQIISPTAAATATIYSNPRSCLESMTLRVPPRFSRRMRMTGSLPSMHHHPNVPSQIHLPSKIPGPVWSTLSFRPRPRQLARPQTGMIIPRLLALTREFARMQPMQVAVLRFKHLTGESTGVARIYVTTARHSCYEAMFNYREMLERVVGIDEIWV